MQSGGPFNGLERWLAVIAGPDLDGGGESGARASRSTPGKQGFYTEVLTGLQAQMQVVTSADQGGSFS